MRKDDHLIFEAFRNKLQENAEVPSTLGEADPALKNTGPGENAEEQNRIVGNDVIQNDQVIGEFLGDSYSSKLTLHGKDMFIPGAPYAQTVNQGTHMGLWYKNKRHKLIVKDASKWKEFLSDIVATGDDKYWDGKKMHQHDHIGDEISATNEYWSKKIAAGADQSPAENAENEPHGYPQGMTAIQNLLLNELKKRGFELTEISHADKERDKYPTVFMMRSRGPMHNVVEIDGMGTINGEPYQEYLHNLKHDAEDAEGVSAAFHYDPMPGLMKAANEIRDILHGAANDEARTEHIINMAQTILGDPTEYDKNEYRKMLDGLIVLLNRFIVVPMN